jgi:membrane protease YdiL (CAAX protease family)
MTLSNDINQSNSVVSWVRQHPLLTYFILAFAGTWLPFAPVWLGTRGLGLLPITPPGELVLILFLIATFAGPMLAAYIVTALEAGKAGVWQFMKRYAQVRVGWQWYALLLLGYPLLFALGVSLGESNLNVFANLVKQWPLFFSIYLPAVVAGLIIPALGEEPGWRGFALPRLQKSYGPIVGTLILGSLHAVWHLPAYVVPGMMSTHGFEWSVFFWNSITIVASTVVWTWFFNKAKGSLFFAMLVHSVSNASGGYIVKLLPELHPNLWLFAALFIAVAALAVSWRISQRQHPKPSPNLKLAVLSNLVPFPTTPTLDAA